MPQPHQENHGVELSEAVRIQDFQNTTSADVDTWKAGETAAKEKLINNKNHNFTRFKKK